MASGMEMMMKSMGFDPAKIQAVLSEAKVEIETRISALESGLSAVTESNTRIEAKIDLILDTMGLDAAKSKAAYSQAHLDILSPNVNGVQNNG